MILEWVAIVLIAAGLVFFFGATVGVLRFPDFYTRVHAAGKGDTLSSMLMILGLALVHLRGANLDAWLVFIKIMLICVFIFFTSPTTTHALTDAGYSAGVQPWKRSSGDGP